MFQPANVVSVDFAILQAIDKLYAAAADESLWPQVMQDVLNITESVGATFCVIDGSDKPRFSAFTSLNFEQKFMEEYLDGMMQHDPTVQHIVSHHGGSRADVACHVRRRPAWLGGAPPPSQGEGVNRKSSGSKVSMRPL